MYRVKIRQSFYFRSRFVLAYPKVLFLNYGYLTQIAAPPPSRLIFLYVPLRQKPIMLYHIGATIIPAGLHLHLHLHRTTQYFEKKGGNKSHFFSGGGGAVYRDHKSPRQSAGVTHNCVCRVACKVCVAGEDFMGTRMVGSRGGGFGSREGRMGQRMARDYCGPLAVNSFL